MKTMSLIVLLASIFITAIHCHERLCFGIQSGIGILGNGASAITCDFKSCSSHDVPQCVNAPKFYIFKPLLKRFKIALKSQFLTSSVTFS
ncbi:hypothetical protein [Serratia marcescens]|uniref:hypothetical protein n=1 Tax=Serratia marcescens TaxID=615 RepID=UPI000A64B161|nr:hypothetical protein [Serratia marcescens]